MAKHEIESEHVGFEHVGKYIRLSLAWPVGEVKRETVVTGVITEVRHTSKHAPHRPVATEVVLDVGMNDAEFVLPQGGSNTIADAIEDFYPVGA